MTNRTDNFNRADNSASLGTPSDGGGAWTAGTGTWGVNSNQGYCSTSTALAVATLEASVSNVEVQGTASVINSDIGVVARFANTSNYLMADFLGATSTRLFKNVAGSFTSLGSGSAGSNGDVIVLRCDSGNNLTVKVNGVSRITATDSAGSTNTKHGIRTHNDTVARIDDFSITEIGAAAVGPLIGGKLIGGMLLKGRLVQ